MKKKYTKKGLEYKKNDNEYYEKIIESVEYVYSINGIDNEFITIRCNDGACLDIPRPDFNIVPGMKARFYGKQFVSVRGVEIDGTIVYYRSVEEEDERHKKWCENYRKDLKQNYDKNIEKYEEQYDNLPPLFKKRMDVLIKKSPHDRYEWEPYELFVLTQAVLIARALKTITDIESWRNREWEYQVSKVPELDCGHSVNTFHGAVIFAKKLVDSEKNKIIY